METRQKKALRTLATQLLKAIVEAIATVAVQWFFRWAAGCLSSL
jgi:hypothetical protein